MKQNHIIKKVGTDQINYYTVNNCIFCYVNVIINVLAELVLKVS